MFNDYFNLRLFIVYLMTSKDQLEEYHLMGQLDKDKWERIWGRAIAVCFQTLSEICLTGLEEISENSLTGCQFPNRDL